MENKNIQIKPIISEKSYNLANASNKYTFSVESNMSKIDIKREVENKYKVKVEDVNITIKPGKMRTDWRTNKKTRKGDTRKAVVTLKKGDKIKEFLSN
jgi:large subunit ribosomal protein L23